MTTNLLQLRAQDVMHKDVQWTTAAENLRSAGERMCRHGIRALLVAGENSTDLPGIVTSKDIVNLLGSQEPALLDQLRIGDVMTRPAVCVPAQTNLRDCINLMRMSGIRRMPVLEGTRVIGVLSTSDIFAQVLQPR